MKAHPGRFQLCISKNQCLSGAPSCFLAGLLIHFRRTQLCCHLELFSVLEANSPRIFSLSVPFSQPCALADAEMFWKIPPFTSTSLRLYPFPQVHPVTSQNLSSHTQQNQPDCSPWLFLGSRGGFGLHTSFVQALSCQCHLQFLVLGYLLWSLPVSLPESSFSWTGDQVGSQPRPHNQTKKAPFPSLPLPSPFLSPFLAFKTVQGWPELGVALLRFLKVPTVCRWGSVKRC